MRRLALVSVALLLAGCVYYPTIPDIGGIRIRPVDSRAVVLADGYAVYMDLENTGGNPDTLIGITSDVAKSATLVNASADQGGRLEVPGATTVSFKPGGPHIVLAELARPLRRGEVFIVTLVFERVGRIGAVTHVE